MSKGKPLDRYGLRVRPEKEILNENAWIIQAFIIFMAKLSAEKLQTSIKSGCKNGAPGWCAIDI